MWTILGLLNIITYLFNDKLGFIYNCLFLSLFIWKNKKEGFFHNIIILMVLYLPLSYTPIFDIFPQQVSIYNILLVIYCSACIIIIIKNKYINFNIFIFNIFIGSILMIRAIISTNILESLIEAIQIYMIIITTSLTLVCLKYIRNKIYKEEYINIYIYMVYATSIGVIFQYMLSSYFNISLGKITYVANRAIYDLLFTGYSVLSIYLASGIVLIIISSKHINSKKIIGIIIILISIVLNTSRTGLYGAIIILGLYYFIKSIKKMSIRSICLLISMCIVGIIAINILASMRGAAIFELSGRERTYFLGIQKFLENPLFGTGFAKSDYNIVLAHNFIIEYLMQLGIIGASPIFFLIIILLFKARKSYLVYIILYFLICGLFVTEIHANTFINVILILILIFMYFKEDKVIIGGTSEK